MNQPKRRLGLSLTCALIGCVVLGIVASALHRSSLSGTVSPLSPASQQISKAIPRLVNASRGEGLPSSQQSRQVNFTNLPVAFEPNLGQTDPQVKYLARGNGYTLFLTPSEAVLTLAPEKTQATKQKSSNRFARFAKSPMMSRNSPAAGTVGAVIRMQVAGGDPHTQIAGTEDLPGISNYFVGKNPGNWRTNVPHYARVGYRDIYPGVNLAFHGAQQQLEFDFVVAPGADPAPIGLQFSGAERIVTDAAGNLILASSAGDLRLHKPVAYQEYQGARRLVDARFVVEGKRVGFVLGNYDRSRELVIDPTLSYSTNLGGTLEDDGLGIAVDASGNAYVTGETASTNFPPAGTQFQSSNAGSFDVFVTKIAANGSSLIYSTYIGGSLADSGNGIAVDSSGNAFVAGGTSSSDFPTSVGASQTTFKGITDAFVLKLDPAGSALVYSTLLGGTLFDAANGLAVDGLGNAYVVGATSSTADFPTLNPIPGNGGGSSNGFVTKVNATGTALVYSTFLGGSTGDFAAAVALDSSKNAYVTGGTLSPTFPHTTGAFQIQCGTDGNCNGGSYDAFITVINAAGSGYVYSTFLGGSGADEGLGIAVDSAANAYVTGLTKSNTNFPLQAALQPTFGGGVQDAFVTKINSTGSAPLVYSTFLGGGLGDAGTSIALDASNNAYLTGQTTSSNFPTTSPTQGTPGGANDGFVTEINAAGSQPLFSTYLGGSQNENTLSGSGPGGAIAVDSAGNIYVTGNTSSANFPPVAAVQGTYGGAIDAFVAKFAPSAGTGNFSITVSPGSATVTHGQTTAPFTVTVTPSGGFNSAVSLSCSGAPTGAACHFNPSSVAGGSGTSSLTISTTAASAQLSPSSQPGLFYALCLPVAGMALLGAGFAPGQSRKRKLVALLLGCLVFSGLMFLAACGGGGGGGGGTPPGTYNVTVKGTAGGVTNNGTPVIQLTVQ
jgi:hypothetical protein